MTNDCVFYGFHIQKELFTYASLFGFANNQRDILK